MEPCPDANVLHGFVSGALAAADAEAVEHHAARCPECRALLSALEVAPPRIGAGTPALDTGPGARPLEPGDTLGRYQVVSRLGAGAMGVVYEADDPELGRRVAIKVLRTGDLDAASRQALERRLAREARALARLSHPNVVTVYDIGDSGGNLYLAMELIDGMTVTEWLATGRRSWREVWAVFRAAGRGLAAAHEAGILHRDFKPDNVIVDRGGVARVVDFGLARPANTAERPDRPPATDAGAAEPTLTHAGMIVGTPRFMAPEQLRGGEATPATDQYGFCVAMWCGLYGRPPFDADTLAALVRQVSAGPPALPAGAPRWLGRALQRGLAADRAGRFPSVAALLDHLEGVPRRRKKVAAIAAALCAVAAAGVIGALASPGGDRQEALCTGSEERFAAVWSGDTAAAVAAALSSRGGERGAAAARRVGQVIDAYRVRWVAEHRETCRATRIRGEQTEAAMGLAMQCLDERLSEVGALAALLSEPDTANVDTAVPAALSLPPVSLCADAAVLAQKVGLPSDPEARARAEALSSELAAIAARMELGAYTEALKPAVAASEAAARLGYRPLEARAYLLRGELEQHTGSPKDAEASIRKAALAAQAGRDDRVLARAWITLAYQIGYERADWTRGKQLCAQAAAALERLGGDAVLEARLERTRGAILADQADLDAALPHFERAAALAAKAAPDTPLAALTLDNLGMAAMMAGQLDRAATLHERSRALRERTLGADHPLVARSLHNLGNVEMARGDTAAAEIALRRAYRLRVEALGPNNPEVATAATDLARALRRQNKLTEALELIRRAVAVVEAAYGADHPLVARQLANLGDLHRRMNDFDAAIATYERAVRILAEKGAASAAEAAFVRLTLGLAQVGAGRTAAGIATMRNSLATLEAKLGPDHHDVAIALVSLGEALVDAGDAREAIPLLERLQSFAPGSFAPAELGQFRFALARALRQAGRDEARARALARDALAHFERAGPDNAGKRGLVAAFLAP